MPGIEGGADPDRRPQKPTAESVRDPQLTHPSMPIGAQVARPLHRRVAIEVTKRDGPTS